MAAESSFVKRSESAQALAQQSPCFVLSPSTSAVSAPEETVHGRYKPFERLVERPVLDAGFPPADHGRLVHAGSPPAVRIVHYCSRQTHRLARAPASSRSSGSSDKSVHWPARSESDVRSRVRAVNSIDWHHL